MGTCDDAHVDGRGDDEGGSGDGNDYVSGCNGG